MNPSLGDEKFAEWNLEFGVQIEIEMMNNKTSNRSSSNAFTMRCKLIGKD